MFRIARRTALLAATFALLLRRWPYRGNRTPRLSTGCLVVVLAGVVTLVATCYLVTLLFVALLFLKGVFP